MPGRVLCQSNVLLFVPSVQISQLWETPSSFEIKGFPLKIPQLHFPLNTTMWIKPLDNIWDPQKHRILAQIFCMDTYREMRALFLRE